MCGQAMMTTDVRSLLARLRIALNTTLHCTTSLPGRLMTEHVMACCETAAMTAAGQSHHASYQPGLAESVPGHSLLHRHPRGMRHQYSGLALGTVQYLSTVCGRNIDAGAAEYERLKLKVCGHAPLLAQVGQAQVVQIKLRLYRLHQPGLRYVHVQREDLLGWQAGEGG